MAKNNTKSPPPKIISAATITIIMYDNGNQRVRYDDKQGKLTIPELIYALEHFKLKVLKE